jgi:tripartite-type tricarboxylate transporter receptor subunit TctC
MTVSPSRRTALAALAALPSVFLPAAAQAQKAAWPGRPIRLVVPFEPGGSTDITARLIAQQLSERIGQPIVVDNRPGAGGNLGSDLVAKAPADGYTLLWGNVAPVAINEHLYAKMPYNALRDFAPISLATVFPNVLVAKPSLPAKSAVDFIQRAAKDFPDLSYGSAGNGSSTHLASEWLASSLHTKWLHVPYKGGSQALLAVAAGQVDLYFSSVPAALPYLKSGQLKAIATTGRTRSAALPDVPTIAESGIAGYEVVNWNGLLAPAGTPAPVVELLGRAMVESLRSADLKARLLAQGAEPAPMTPAQFQDYIRSESAKWARVIKLANVKLN